MKTSTKTESSLRRLHFSRASLAILAAAAIGIGGVASAQEPLPREPISLVPSIGVASTPRVAEKQTPQPSARRDPAPPAARVAGSRWNDFPVSRRVPLKRASFDRSGYYLYNVSGATISVPFVGGDLHVMKFAVSPDGTTFFVNDGTAPVLYLPQGGYLLNSGVPGAHWYPFPAQFQPAQPFFLAIAPSYSEFIGVRWFSNTVTYGGYYGAISFRDGGVFQPTPGLTFSIGTQVYNGWSPFRDFLLSNPQLQQSQRYSRPRPVASGQGYTYDQRYYGERGGYDNGFTYYPYDPYGSNFRQYDGYVPRDGGYTYPSGGGFGFPGGGFGFPGGGASSGAPMNSTPTRRGVPGAPLPYGGTPGARLPRGGTPGSF